MKTVLQLSDYQGGLVLSPVTSLDVEPNDAISTQFAGEARSFHSSRGTITKYGINRDCKVGAAINSNPFRA
jgi:hypothetical protein